MIEHYYESMNEQELKDLFDNFLINSWSFSKLSTFSRNEKAFEMAYIYGCKSKMSSTTVSGMAYHEALKHYFQSKKEGVEVSVVELESIAFDFIENYPANKFKLQKTTPTVDDCIQKAVKTSTNLVNNFYKEKGIYEDEIHEVLEVEEYMSAWLTINGVDIPMPCNSMIDLVVRLNNGEIAIIDHKSKASFSSEEELKLSIGKQAITYVNIYEKTKGLKASQVWFIENKYSINRDNSPQLNAFKITIDDDTKKLYEVLLYEPLKRMIDAVSNPDYVYLINEADSYTDSAEIHAFWAKTMIAEVEDFNVSHSKKEMVSKRLKKIRDASIGAINPSVIKQFKDNANAFIQYDLNSTNMNNQEKIEHILRTFGVIVKVAHTFDGFSSNTYLLEVSSGVKISKVQTHKMDIANALDVPSIRVMSQLVVFEGKSYLAIESSKKRERVLEFDNAMLEGMRIPIGIDNYGQKVVWDLENQSTPHVLICGATGSGKSVSIRSTIEYAKLAGVKNIIVLDPKYEFSQLNIKGVEVYSEINDIENEMSNLVEHMNNLVKNGQHEKTLVIFDEFADAVSASRSGRELDLHEEQHVGFFANGNPKMKRVTTGRLKSLEENLKILLQKGRSCGFRIIAATQRASVKVITGDAKVNFPVQICFRVPKEVDSKVVLDESGAESLSGMGDGLINSPEYSGLVRFQGFYYN